jgi:hypothetical protein
MRAEPSHPKQSSRAVRSSRAEPREVAEPSEGGSKIDRALIQSRQDRQAPVGAGTDVSAPGATRGAPVATTRGTR